MNRKFRIISVLLFLLLVGGCASMSGKKAIGDFVDGTVSGYEQRQQNQSNTGVKQDKKLKSRDAISGVFNVLLQSIVDLFDSEKTD